MGKRLRGPSEGEPIEAGVQKDVREAGERWAGAVAIC